MTNLLLVYLLIGFIVSIVFAVFISKIGSRKEIGGNNAFLVSLFFSPFLGLVIVLASEDLKDGERRPVNAGLTPGFIAFLVVVFGIFFVIKWETERVLAQVNETVIDTTVVDSTAVDTTFVDTTVVDKVVNEETTNDHDQIDIEQYRFIKNLKSSEYGQKESTPISWDIIQILCNMDYWACVDQPPHFVAYIDKEKKLLIVINNKSNPPNIMHIGVPEPYHLDGSIMELPSTFR
jgi:hypothetical protein